MSCKECCPFDREIASYLLVFLCFPIDHYILYGTPAHSHYCLVHCISSTSLAGHSDHLYWYKSASRTMLELRDIVSC